MFSTDISLFKKITMDDFIIIYEISIEKKSVRLCVYKSENVDLKI